MSTEWHVCKEAALEAATAAVAADGGDREVWLGGITRKGAVGIRRMRRVVSG